MGQSPPLFVSFLSLSHTRARSRGWWGGDCHSKLWICASRLQWAPDPALQRTNKEKQSQSKRYNQGFKKNTKKQAIDRSRTKGEEKTSLWKWDTQLRRGGVRMMRGRDEDLWSVCMCVCVCEQCNQRHINKLETMLLFKKHVLVLSCGKILSFYLLFADTSSVWLEVLFKVFKWNHFFLTYLCFTREMLCRPERSPSQHM